MSGFAAEIFQECQACDRRRSFFVQAGKAICSSCGWSPDGAGQRVSLAHLSAPPRECPGCGKGTLAELTAGRWACHGCAWEGNPSAGSSKTVVTYRGVEIDAEVAWALRQDEHRGEPGGGSKSKSNKEDKLKTTRLRETDDSVWASRATLLATRDKVFRVTNLDATSEEIREALSEIVEGGGEEDGEWTDFILDHEPKPIPKPSIKSCVKRVARKGKK